ncbi:MAG: MFS transporter [Deinococcales bacterium]
MPWAIVILYLNIMAAFIVLYTPQALLVPLAAHFALSPAEVSLSLSLTVLSLAFASLLVGPLSDRWGRKPVILLSAFLAALAALLSALAQSWGQFLACRALIGLCLPGVMTVSVAYIAEEVGEGGAARALGGYIAATVTGGLLSRFLSGFIGDYWGLPQAFLSSGAVMLLSALALSRLPSPKAFQQGGSMLKSYLGMLSHLKNLKLLGGFAVGFSLFFAFMAVFSYLPFYVAAPPFSLSPSHTGLLYLVYGAGIFASPLAATWVKRFGPEKVIIIAMTGVILANLLSLNANLWGLILALLGICFSNFTAQASATAYVAVNAPRYKAGASALYLFSYYLGGSLGAYLPGVLWLRLGWRGVLLSTISMLLLGIFAIYQLSLRSKL